jgi:16S rRNA (guanine(966)-N(2))-methyltransferase RsmD
MLQLIAGRFRRRKLRSPKDESVTRPIPARVRESIFNMLAGHVENETLFDAFAGAGTFGLEAISRGARHVVTVERDRTIAKLLRQNIAELGVPTGEPPPAIDPDDDDQLGAVTVVQADALGPAALAACPSPVHVVFFDPPYPLMWDAASRRRVLRQFASVAERLDDTGFAIIRTPWPLRAPKRPDNDDNADAATDAIATASPSTTPQAPSTAPNADASHDAGDESGELESLPGLLGPETHVYGSMAVHWYMRRQPSDDPADVAADP